MVARAKDEPRLPPLEPPYDDGVARSLDRLMGGTGAEPLLFFRTVAHNPHLLDKLRSTGSYLLNFGTIDPLEREIVILRTTARCGSEYEWGVHVAIFSEQVGLTKEQVVATVIDGAAWSERQSLLIRLVDELHDTDGVSAELWEQLRERWPPDQLVEVVALVGQYHAISFFTNAFALAPEDYGARFPTTRRGPA
jgi:alkylhydroperoxidase family enzyme